MNEGESAKSALREAAETVFFTIVIFLLIQIFIQNFRIQGPCMEPSLYTGQRLVINKIVYLLHPPQRGDIIVFKYPRDPRRDFIKRVIGLPGEEVEVREGRVFINGQELNEPYATNFATYSWGPKAMGPEEFFVLGDNRNNSSDSHNWGPVPRKYIVGKAWISYWPPRYWGLAPHHSFSQ
ncbi:MAG: signal peptidase I [Chloroflexota bacterium]|nr:signal peptidase I [Chloroflexota bacterium]